MYNFACAAIICAADIFMSHACVWLIHVCLFILPMGLADSMIGIQSLLDVIVLLVSVVSIALCGRSIYRAFLLARVSFA